MTLPGNKAPTPEEEEKYNTLRDKLYAMRGTLHDYRSNLYDQRSEIQRSTTYVLVLPFIHTINDRIRIVNCRVKVLDSLILGLVHEERRLAGIKKRADALMFRMRTTWAGWTPLTQADIHRSLPVGATAVLIGYGGPIRQFMGHREPPPPILYPEAWPDEPDAPADTKPENYCAICLVRANATAHVPCGHVCSCVTCAVAQKPRTCPICRTVLTSVIRLYNNT
jgi:hypothetical protein